MGRLLQLPFITRRWEQSALIMLKFCALLLIVSTGQGLPKNRVKDQVKCGVVETIIHEEKCHHEEVCHDEFEVIVTTTVIEECEDIMTKHCHKEHKNVYHTTNIVGHDSSIVGHEVGHSYGGHESHNFHKRDADHLGGSHHSSEPHCVEHVEKKCHNKPIEDSHKVPHGAPLPPGGGCCSKRSVCPPAFHRINSG